MKDLRDIVDPAILRLAQSLGVPLSLRNASDSWLWDGHTLAVCHNQYISEDDFHVVPLETTALLHDLGHWVACSDIEQRLFPEFGLPLGIALSTAIGSEGDGYWNGGFLEAASAFQEGLIGMKESGIQESLAQLLSAHWGEALGILCKFEGMTWPTWADYLIFKDEEAHKYGWVEAHEEAKSRLPEILGKISASSRVTLS